MAYLTAMDGGHVGIARAIYGLSPYAFTCFSLWALITLTRFFLRYKGVCVLNVLLFSEKFIIMVVSDDWL